MHVNTHPIEEVEDEEDNKRHVTHVEYAYADNTRFFVSIVDINTNH